LDQIISQQPPLLKTDDARISKDACVFPDCKGQVHSFAACTNGPDRGKLPDDNACLKPIPVPLPDESESDWQRRVDADLDELIPTIQTHCPTHTATCFKDAENKRRRAKRRAVCCRFKYPRPIASLSTFAEEGKIVLQRLHHFTNPFNRYVSICCRANHDIQPLWGIDAALAVIFYVTNYSTVLRDLQVRPHALLA
jgi:hypothetical protein